MIGSSKKCADNLKNINDICNIRYKHALDVERSFHANEFAKKAERLRLIYKTRFEEDLRAFIVSHKTHEISSDSQILKYNNPKPLRSASIYTHKYKIATKNAQNSLETKKSSFIPTWAWPASLRNNEDLKSISLFYTAENSVPLSPSQIGGNCKKLTQISKFEKHCSNSDNRNSLRKNKIPNKNDQEKLYNQSLIEPKNEKQTQRQKLRSKFGAPFTWIQNKSRDNIGIVLSPFERSSGISTPQSQVFTEIPKQPSIYPLELERDNVKTSLGISEFIKRSQKMQKALEILLERNLGNNIRNINLIDNSNTQILNKVD